MKRDENMIKIYNSAEYQKVLAKLETAYSKSAELGNYIGSVVEYLKRINGFVLMSELNERVPKIDFTTAVLKTIRNNFAHRNF